MILLFLVIEYNCSCRNFLQQCVFMNEFSLVWLVRYIRADLLRLLLLFFPGHHSIINLLSNKKVAMSSYPTLVWTWVHVGPHILYLS